MKNICIFLDSFFPNDTRVEKEIKTMNKLGYKTTVIALNYETDDNESEWEGTKIYYVKHKKNKNRGFQRFYDYFIFPNEALAKLKQIEGKEEFDIYWITNPPDNLISLIGERGKKYEIKVIADIHDPYPELIGTHFPKIKPFRWIAEKFERDGIKVSDRIVTVSKECQEAIQNRTKRKVDLLYNYPSNEIKRVYIEDIDQRYLRMADIRLTFIGNFYPHSGVKDAIKAVLSIGKTLSDHHAVLLVIGDGAEMDSLKQLVEEQDQFKVIYLLGRQKYEKVKQYWSISDIALIPAKNTVISNMAIPNKLADAMFLGKVIITSRLTSHLNFAEDNVIYFNPEDINDFADKIKEVLENFTEVKEKYGKKHEELCWEAQEETIKEILEGWD